MLLDLEIPVLDGMEAIGRIKQEHADVKVIMISTHNREKLILHAMNIGTAEYMLRWADTDEIVERVHRDRCRRSNQLSIDPPQWLTTADNPAFVAVAKAYNVGVAVDHCVTAMVGSCEPTSCISVTVDLNTDISPTEVDGTKWSIVQPDPSNVLVALRPSAIDATTIGISLRNGSGLEVLAPFIFDGQHGIELDLGEVAPSAYYLLATRNGEQHFMKSMVQRYDRTLRE